MPKKEIKPKCQSKGNFHLQYVTIDLSLWIFLTSCQKHKEGFLKFHHSIVEIHMEKVYFSST